MIRFTQILGIAALILFTYAQWYGWTFDRIGSGQSNSFSRSSYHK